MLDETVADILAGEATTYSPGGNIVSASPAGKVVATAPAVQPEPAVEMYTEVSPVNDWSPADPRLSAVADRLISDKRSEYLKEATAVQYGSCAALFTKITGITDVRAIDQNALKSFKEGLHKIPVSYGKSTKDKVLSYEQILAKADAMPDEKVGLSPTTVNRHLDHIKQILEKAAEDEIVLPHKVNTTKLRIKEKSGIATSAHRFASPNCNRCSSTRSGQDTVAGIVAMSRDPSSSRTEPIGCR